MDPITTTILTALVAGAAAGATKLGETSILDAYESLKLLIAKKLGHDSEVFKAIGALDAKPDSNGRKETLKEELVASDVAQDSKVLDAARFLLDQLENLQGGEQHIQHAVGNFIAQADRNSSASVNINQSD